MKPQTEFDFGSMLEFRSSAFPSQQEDADMVNEGMHGFALACFLADGLRTRGFTVHEPIDEDWGWYVAVANEGFELAYGCNAIGETDFLVQIIPDKPVIRKLFSKIETAGPVRALAEAIFATLSESGKIEIGPNWVEVVGSSLP